MSLLFALFVAGCGNSVSISKQKIDNDSDGYLADVDCDDEHASVNPDAPEVCDGLDNNCNDQIDDNVADAPTWYYDDDGDGFGGESEQSCDKIEGTVEEGGDCNDADPEVAPGKAEHCDGIDEDCDGEIDEDAIDATLWYRDEDGDGYGAAIAEAACQGEAGLAPTNGDCDDSDINVHPGATEEDCADPRDYNCDGTVGYVDADGDGSAACRDCDDGDKTIYPGATESCNEKDDDCNGLKDDGALIAYYADADGDGYGDIGVQQEACVAPLGFTSDSSDCDDANGAVYPGAAEFCDGLDHDCDSLILENNSVDVASWYPDGDGDNWGAMTGALSACAAPSGYLADHQDCDDTNGSIYPGAAEHCDGTDEDCDGSVDEGAVDGTLYWADADGDGYGNAATPQSACTTPSGYVSDSSDCDDSSGIVYPGATEYCDGVDHDCDGLLMESSSVDVTKWYPDGDGDGWGSSVGDISACQPPTGYVANYQDCNDTSNSVYPGATEHCDNRDEDCDGSVDEAAVDAVTYWVDGDGDGYGGTNTATSCVQMSGYVLVGGDCDDKHTSTSPAAKEICDVANSDEDCNGLSDNSDPAAANTSTFYQDSDRDGYGGTITIAACDQPSGYVTNKNDCNDSSSLISPAATEVCDSSNTDEDCDGLADDADSSATSTSTWYADADRDGYGGTNTTSACDLPSGYVATSTDCDDTSASSHPGGTEVCGDGVDQDCTGGDSACPRWSGAYVADSGYDSKIYGMKASTGEYGYGLAAGDFNGDGIGDIVTSDLMYTYSGSYAGTVFGYYGPIAAGAADALTDDDFVYYTTEFNYDQTYGGRLSTVGDVNSDGKDDLLVSGLGDVGLLYYGGDTGVSSHATKVDFTTGCSIGSALGNWDASSVDDEWICSVSIDTNNTGAVSVYSGVSTASSGTYTGEATNDYAGNSVSGGDLDGDGLDDFVVGAEGQDAAASAAGAVYVMLSTNYHGNQSLKYADAKITGAAANDYFGRTVSIVGDVNGDGQLDLAIGAYGVDTNGNNAGAVYLDTAPASGSISSQTWGTILGTSTYYWLGNQTIGAGNFDGDATPDIVVGDDLGGSQAGLVALFYNPSSGSHIVTSADATWTGSASDRVGFRAAAMPDTNGDGRDELVFSGTNGDNGASTNMGAVWVWEAP